MLDDATTLHAGRHVETRDAGAVVRARQDELLRAGYLLTGDEAQATTLAQMACLDMLPTLLRGGDGQGWRDLLLRALARRYLTAPPAAAPATTRTTPLDSAPGRYRLDDGRERIWAALALCDPPQRLALVLRDFCRLDEGIVTELTGWPPYQLRERLAAARERVRAAAGVRADQSAQGVLLALSLGVPRVDLWDRLAEPVRRLAETERRRRKLLTWGALGAVTLLTVLGALWLGALRLPSTGDDDARAAVVGPTSTPRATPTPIPTATATLALIDRPIVTVPDRHIIQYSYPDGEQWRYETRIFDPATGEWSAPQDFGQFGNVNISPDGQWLVDVFTEDLGEEEYEQTLVVRDAARGEVAWERVIPPDVWIQLRLVGDRIYAFERAREAQTGAELPRLTAYDMFDGTPLGAWELDVSSSVDGGLADLQSQQLFPSPDGERLYLVLDQVSGITNVGRRTIITYRFDDMTVVSDVAVEFEPDEQGSPRFFSVWGAHMTPDGEALYQYQNWEGQVRVQFLDLATAELSALEIPITAPLPGPQGSAPAGFTVSTTSHDGRYIYVISNTGEVAVVDLARRQVERVFQLDTAGHRFPAKDGLVGWWYNGQAYFSPDGSRLYLLDTWSVQTQEIDPSVTSTIWVIDVAQWRIAERWELPGISTSLVLSADGGRAYMQTRVPPGTPDSGADWENRIYAVDTATGVLTDIAEQLDLPEGQSSDVMRQGWSEITTLQQAYFWAYGVLPSTGGGTPEDLTEFSTLPLLELATGEPVIAAGQQARFTVRFLDPATRRTLAGPSPEVRFDPDAAVTLTLSLPEQPDIIVIPLKVDAATWEAALPIDSYGSWSAAVSVSYGDGTRWTSRWPAALDVAPSFLGDDGKHYAYHLSVNPAEPVVDQSVVMRVELRSVEEGAPLPEGVALEGGLPERVNVVMLGDGIKSETLPPIAHGVWEDETSFRWAGRWQTELSINQPDVDEGLLKINAGSIRAVPGS